MKKQLVILVLSAGFWGGVEASKPNNLRMSLQKSSKELKTTKSLNQALYNAASYLQGESNLFKTNHFLMGLYMVALTYNDVAFKAATATDSLKRDKYSILLQFPYLLSQDELDDAYVLTKDTFGEGNPYAEQLQQVATILYQECSSGSFNGRISQKNRGQFLSLMDNLPNPGSSDINANALYFIASIYQAMEQTLQVGTFANTVDQSCLPYKKVYEFMVSNAFSWVGVDAVSQNVAQAFLTYLEWIIKVGQEVSKPVDFFSDAWLESVLQPSQLGFLPNAVIWYADATFKPTSAQVNACLATIQSLVQEDLGLSTTDLYQLQKNVFIVQGAKLAGQKLSPDQLTTYYAGLLRLGVEFAQSDPNETMQSLVGGDQTPLAPLSSCFTNQALINYIQNASAWIANQGGSPLDQSYFATPSLSAKNFSVNERAITKSIGYQKKTSTTPTDSTYSSPFYSVRDMGTLEKALYQVVVDNQGMFFVGPNGTVNYTDNDHWMLYSFGMVRLGLQGFNQVNAPACSAGVPNEGMPPQPVPYFSLTVSSAQSIAWTGSRLSLLDWQSQFWQQMRMFLLQS